MKTSIYTFIFLFISSLLFSQYIEGLSVTQNGTNQIKAHLKVYLPASGENISYIQDITQNTITINACYYMIGTGAVTEIDKEFYIDIPNNANYTLKVNLYISWNETICDYHSLEDTATLNFSTPVEGTVSLNTNNINGNNEKLTLYPNPVKDLLNIGSILKIDKINIYDISGKQIYKISSPKENKIDISKLENGIYFLEAISATKKWRQKFIKQK